MSETPDVDVEPVPADEGGAAGAVVRTATTNGLIAVISLATGILVARLLGPEARGHLAAAMVLGSIVGALGAIALGESLVFFIGRRRASPVVVLKSVIALALMSSAVVLTIGFLLTPLILRGQPGAVAPARTYLFIGLTYILLGFPITFFRSMQQYRLWNRLRLISPACWLGTVLLFVVLGEAELVPIIAVFIVSQALCAPFVWRLVRRFGSRTERADRALFAPMARFGLPLLLATLPQTLNLRLDQLFIANLANAGDLGLYAVSVSWAGMGLPLVAAIGSVLFPSLASKRGAGAGTSFGRATRGATIIALFVSASAAVSAPFMIPLLFGEEFAVPVRLSVLLGGATVFLGVNDVLEEGLRGLGKPRVVLTAELVGLLATVGTLALLVPHLGITGAALSSLAGYVLITATLLWFIRSEVGLAPSSVVAPRLSDLKEVSSRLRAALPLPGRRGGRT